MNGASTMIPQKPRITLGIAASISTSGPTTARTPGRAITAKYSPIAIPSGVASASATSEVTSVPKIHATAP